MCTERHLFTELWHGSCLFSKLKSLLAIKTQEENMMSTKEVSQKYSSFQDYEEDFM